MDAFYATSSLPFPGARLTACDIDTDAVDFCALTFGATPIYSHGTPENIPLKGNYDLIWVGSLLTHLNTDECIDFLDVFPQKPPSEKGLVVFTIHRRIEDQIRRGVSTYGLDPGGIPDSCWNAKARDARINVSRGNSKVDHSACWRWNGKIRD